MQDIAGKASHLDLVAEGFDDGFVHGTARRVVSAVEKQSRRADRLDHVRHFGPALAAAKGQCRALAAQGAGKAFERMVQPPFVRAAKRANVVGLFVEHVKRNDRPAGVGGVGEGRVVIES